MVLTKHIMSIDLEKMDQVRKTKMESKYALFSHFGFGGDHPNFTAPAFGRQNSNQTHVCLNDCVF